MEPTEKICPILIVAGLKEESLPVRQCLGEQCALFVKIMKPASGPMDFDTAYYRYHGCGLVSGACIPWDKVPVTQRKNDK